MSGVYSSTQHREPGTLASSTPLVRPGCQIPNGTPARSARTAMWPWPITSIGWNSTLPWACSAALAVAWASSLWKYTVQAGGPWPGPVCIPPATVFPSNWKKPYPPASGPADWNRQPNRAP